MGDSKLAPLAGKMTETPAGEIPVNKIKLPKGFKAELWASGMPGARAMAEGDKGKIYIGTRGIGLGIASYVGGRPRGYALAGIIEGGAALAAGTGVSIWFLVQLGALAS